MACRIERPVRFKDLEQHFKPRPADKETPIAVERHFHVAADKEPKVSTHLQHVERGNGRSS